MSRPHGNPIGMRDVDRELDCKADHEVDPAIDREVERKLDRDVDRARRTLLMAAPLGLLAACAPPAPMASAFSARFRVAGTGAIALDYADERHFAFTPDIGWGSTCVVAGQIYLVMLPSLATASRMRVIWAGELGPSAATAPAHSLDMSLRRSAVPTAAQERWDLDRPAQDLAWPQEPGTTPATVTVAELAPLARAQHTIDTRMRPAMDMSLCGDGVNRLVGAWPSQITRHGLAVLASSLGAELMAPLQPLARTPALPQGVEIEDFRVAFGRS